jgi:hypothetical protein
MELSNKYPTLFHKYILNISDMNDDILYTSSNKIGPFKENICHLHIYDISKFDMFYGSFVERLYADYSIIVTYSFGTPSLLEKERDIVYIQVRNRGYDIGGKICALDYLQKMDVAYKYVLFLHSKTDKSKRELYFRPFINNLKQLKDIFATEKLLGVFPNILWMNHNGVKNYRGYDLFDNNELYLKDMFDYLGVEPKNRIKLFAEGNCMALHKKVIDFVFQNNYKLFYNILNEENSFDYNWFVTYYKRKNTIANSYNEYCSRNLFGNNNIPRRYADGMIEHVFERLWINVILQLGGEYTVLH